MGISTTQLSSVCDGSRHSVQRQNSVDLPLPIDFHLHLLVDKSKKKKGTLWVVVALADAAIHRRQPERLTKKRACEMEKGSEKGKKRSSTIM